MDSEEQQNNGGGGVAFLNQNFMDLRDRNRSSSIGSASSLQGSTDRDTIYYFKWEYRYVKKVRG